MQELIKSLKEHEGYRKELYLDSMGHLTGGWGHLIVPGDEFPEEVWEIFFKQDVAIAISEFAKIQKSLRDKLDPARRRVIVEMVFNIGLSKVLLFKKMWAAIERRDFVEAAKEMLDSKWAKQVKGRAVRLAKIMEEGENNYA